MRCTILYYKLIINPSENLLINIKISMTVWYVNHKVQLPLKSRKTGYVFTLKISSESIKQVILIQILAF